MDGAAGKKPGKSSGRSAGKKASSHGDMSKVFKVVDDECGRESPDSVASSDDVRSEVSESEVSDGVKSEISR